MRVLLAWLPNCDVGVTTGHVPWPQTARIRRVDRPYEQRRVPVEGLLAEPVVIFYNDLCGRLNNWMPLQATLDDRGPRWSGWCRRGGMTDYKERSKQDVALWDRELAENRLRRSFICAAAGQGFHIYLTVITATLKLLVWDVRPKAMFQKPVANGCACIAGILAGEIRKGEYQTQCSWTSLTTGGLYAPIRRPNGFGHEQVTSTVASDR